MHLLTLQLLGDGKYLLRLEHQFEMDEAPWNEPATMSLSVSHSQRELHVFYPCALCTCIHMECSDLHIVPGHHTYTRRDNNYD